MAAPVIFRSTDASAPALNGNAGSLVNVLNWCLLSGGSASNLGWSSPFTATNKAVYRPAGGVQHYLDVDDSGPDGTALGRNARIRGYETMSAVGTGTGAFPTTAQVTTCVGIVKSTATGTTARPWLLIGDDKGFWFFCESAGTDPPVLASHTWTAMFWFGEVVSVLTGDLYRTSIGYQSTTTAVVTAGTGALAGISVSTNTGIMTMNMARGYSGAGTGLWIGLLGNGAIAALATTAPHSLDGGNFTFPNPADGGLYMNAVDVLERGSGTTAAASTGFRGRMRGLYQTAYSGTGIDDQTTFTGVGDFAGKTFIYLKTTAGGVAFETTAWAFSS